MTADFLEQMAQSSRMRVAAAIHARSFREINAQARASEAPPVLTASAQGFDLIAEVKLRSPAAGALKSTDENVAARVAGYGAAGAAAVSVLTEPDRFDGSLAHLESAARALKPLGVPAMRKDFLVDPYQVCEARIAGAGGVLVILRMLPREDLEALIRKSQELGLFVLLEAFDERDIELAHELVAKFSKKKKPRPGVSFLVGVNCRDLTTLQVVPGRLEQLAQLLPTSVPRVAESGVGSAADAGRVAVAGYDWTLVGSALMQAPDPAALVRDMLAAGRAARSG